MVKGAERAPVPAAPPKAAPAPPTVAPAPPKATTSSEPVAASKPAEPAQAPATRPAPAAAPVSGSLQEQWEALLEAVRGRSKVTHTHLRQGWPVELDGDKLIVGFDRDFHAEQLTSKPEHVQRLNDVMEQVFGRKLNLKPQVGARPSETGSNGDAQEHDAVDLVKKGLGAEVVEEVSSS